MNNKIKLVIVLLASEAVLLAVLVEYSASVVGR